MTLAMRSFSIKLALFIAIIVLGMLVSGCADSFRPVTFENSSSLPVTVGLEAVTLEYTGPYVFRYTNIKRKVVLAGESSTRSYSGPKYFDEDFGSQFKYLVTAQDDDLNFVYYRLFTWTELNDAGWHVVIDPALSD